MSAQADLEAFVSYLCLVYHEARNVRFLVKEGHIQAERYEVLRSLPKNRAAAWSSLQDLRREALQTGSAAAASQVFADRFALTLERLVELYGNPNWKYAQLFGGNRWSTIAREVIGLRDALDQEDATRTADLVTQIPRLRHGTGLLGEKLLNLDAVLEERPAPAPE